MPAGTDSMAEPALRYSPAKDWLASPMKVRRRSAFARDGEDEQS